MYLSILTLHSLFHNDLNSLTEVEAVLSPNELVICKQKG